MQNLTQNHLLFKQNPLLLAEFQQFEQKIYRLAQQVHIPLHHYEIDHLAVRVNNLAQAQDWQHLLTKCGRILSQNLVNGRPIFLFDLFEPLLFMQQKVSIIELPYPKDKQYPQQGWEHIEIVLPFLANESLNEWLMRVEKQFLLNQSPHLMVKISEPKVEGERLANPSIAVSLKDKTDNHCCIKVHPYHIKQIIEV
ncbi:VOC family protein [Volucribacter amazonae]|uniref:Metalloprotein n=1 Tax=Volucribacter amazonae TaxID=256731 RepID=A0A9X4PBL6_9PAST|nr:VOC family protein [Volucribacter amazonae]MDG6894654.1 metalloprotein [Volucribacter amazonae]